MSVRSTLYVPVSFTTDIPSLMRSLVTCSFSFQQMGTSDAPITKELASATTGVLREGGAKYWCIQFPGRDLEESKARQATRERPRQSRMRVRSESARGLRESERARETGRRRRSRRELPRRTRSGRPRRRSPACATSQAPR